MIDTVEKFITALNRAEPLAVVLVALLLALLPITVVSAIALKSIF